MRSVAAIVLGVVAALLALASPAAARAGCCAPPDASARAVKAPVSGAEICGSEACCCAPEAPGAPAADSLRPVCDSCDCYSRTPHSSFPFVPSENRTVQVRTAVPVSGRLPWNPSPSPDLIRLRVHAPAHFGAGPPVYLLKRVFRI